MKNITHSMVPLMVLASVASMALGQAAQAPDHLLVQERNEVAEYSRLLEDPELWRRIRATQSLAAMVGHAREPEAIRALLERALSDARVAEHFGSLHGSHGSKDGLDAAARAQAAASHRSDLERRELDEYADALGREAEVRLKTVVALSALLQTAEQPEPVVRLLELSSFDRDPAVAAQATRALKRWERRQVGEIGNLGTDDADQREQRRLDAERAEVVEYRHRLEDPELSVRLSAVVGLAALSKHAINRGPVLELLGEAASHPDPAVAAQAVWALGRRGGPD